MRYMAEDLWDVWEGGQYVGDNRPYGRVVIRKSMLQSTGPFRSLLFGQTEPYYEIPTGNIRSINIDRRLGADAASMTLELTNQVTLDAATNLDLTYSGLTTGPSIRSLKDLGQPGFYSFRRGMTPSSASRWGHDIDPVWGDMFIPNRVLATFQGYGTDGSLTPWDDTKVVLTGIWLIDSVEYRSNGMITVNCRDSAKLLIEQRLYPPIVPIDQYPLEFCVTHSEINTQTIQTTTTTPTSVIQVAPTVGANVARHISTYPDSSSAPWYGYNASVYGHRASHAFDGDGSTYWLSVGNSGPNQVWSYEWIGADCGGEPVNQVYFRPKWGGYVCYVAVKENGVWQGTNVVPYGYNSGPAYPNGSNKPYVLKTNIPYTENWVTIDLPRAYNASQVWLIFTNLADSNLGTYQYRAGVIEFQVRHITVGTTQTIGGETVVTEETVDVETIIPGNIADYTDIVKILCAWSGFYWPYGTPADPALAPMLEDSDDPATLALLSNGRIWGDFMYSGAYPVEPPCIPASFWDNKSVMDGINQIKEILGFLFYIDSTGGVVWRMPNIWRTGNYLTGVGFVGTDSVRDIDEEKVLIDYGVTVDDTNLRSEIIVVSADDPTLHTAIQPGFAGGEVIPSAVNPQGDLSLLGNQQRIMLVPNYPFVSQAEVDKFAYLVSLWIHWSYRKGRFRIPGNPAFEPDDQVRIFERVTSESYIHYVQGIRSQMDLEKGTWFLDVDTHWLGNGPDETWVVNRFNDMPPALYAYLVAIGEIEEDGDPTNLPDGWDPTFPMPEPPDDVPRLDVDLDQLFPNPPTIAYPYDDTWSDEDIANEGTGWVAPPGPTGGGTVNSRSEAWRYQYWGSRGSDLTTITFMTKWLSVYGSLPPADVPTNTHAGQLVTVSTTVPRLLVGAYRLMANMLADQGYYVYSCAAFAGVDRKIAGTNTYSAHAWGLAIDINPNINPCCTESWATWYARPASPDFFAAVKNITQRIRTVSTGERVFGWGGYWTNKKDYMHLEVLVTKAACAGGFTIV